MTGTVTSAHLFVVAGLYGFLKMANWAGVPSIVPALVADTDHLGHRERDGVGQLRDRRHRGAGRGGSAHRVIGATSVLGIDAASYQIFVIICLPSISGGTRPSPR